MERFFQINPNAKYTEGDIELKEYSIREKLLSSGHIDKRFKRLDSFRSAERLGALHALPTMGAPMAPLCGMDTALFKSRYASASGSDHVSHTEPKHLITAPIE